MKTTTHLLTLVAAATVAFSAPAIAASSKATDKFVKNATIGNEFEVRSSKLALDKSDNEDVKDFAQQMVDDHTKASNELKATIRNSKVDSDIIPKELDNKHQKILDKLDSLSGKSFDAEYIKAQTNAHNEAVDLFRDYSKNGDDADLKKFAADTLPTLEEHQEHVKKLSAK